MSEFFIKYIDKNTIFPKQENISAVFLICLKDDKILAIRNDRGWDIPGGHIEKGESSEEALIREVNEEAGASFSNQKLFAIVESTNQDIYKDKVMLLYTTDTFVLGEFVPSEDAFDREIIDIEEFLKRYSGRFDFKEIISKAQNLLNML